MKGKRVGFLMICNKLYSIRNISVSLLKKVLEKRTLQTIISSQQPLKKCNNAVLPRKAKRSPRQRSQGVREI